VWLSGKCLPSTHRAFGFHMQTHKTKTKMQLKPSRDATSLLPRAWQGLRPPKFPHSVPIRLALLSPTVTVTLEAVASWKLVWEGWIRWAKIL
jgi:hypothetical protein